MMNITAGHWMALAAATLFAISIPASKPFLADIPALWLAVCTNLGVTIGLSLAWLPLRTTQQSPVFTPSDSNWLMGSVLLGGILAPCLAISALAIMPAANTSLFSSFEGVFTGLVAWLFFQSRMTWPMALGMLAITFGALILVLSSLSQTLWTAGAIWAIAAYLLWGIDTNFIARLSHHHPVHLFLLKSLFSSLGLTGLALVSTPLPSQVPLTSWLILGLIGLIGYGLSYILLLYALKTLGAARTGGFMSLVPFIGIISSALYLGERLSFTFLIAATIVAAGVLLLSGQASPGPTKAPANLADAAGTAHR